MTVANSTMEWSLVCDGATENTTGVPVTSQVYDDDELEVILKTVADGTEATLTKTSDYTVTGVPGKTIAVITTSAYSSAYELYVRRTAILTQEEDLVSGDAFPSEVMESILDKYVMTSQVVNNNVDRSIQVSVASGLSGLTVIPTASKIIGFNAAGTDLMLYDTSTTSGDASLADLLSSSGFGTIIYPQEVQVGSTGIRLISGSGTPEASITAAVGSIYMRTNGATLTALYIKVSGAGNTGWRQVINANDTSGNVDLGAGTITTTGALTAASISTAGTALKTKIVNIGDWDMNATEGVSVAHGLTANNIRSITGVIRNDDKTKLFTIAHVSGTAATALIPLAFVKTIDATDGSYDATNIFLQRFTGGVFDSADYDDVGGAQETRGWITITYV